ncbi:hypothetical protein EJB05_28117, partial [Eragrostis curvula]
MCCPASSSELELMLMRPSLKIPERQRLLLLQETETEIFWEHLRWYSGREISEPDMVEPIAFREGLALTSDLAVQHLRLACDNGGRHETIGHIVKDIKATEATFCTSDFVHESRRSNVDAHNISRSSIYVDFGRHVWLLNLLKRVCNSYSSAVLPADPVLLLGKERMKAAPCKEGKKGMISFFLVWCTVHPRIHVMGHPHEPRLKNSLGGSEIHSEYVTLAGSRAYGLGQDSTRPTKAIQKNLTFRAEGKHVDKLKE